MGLFSGPRREAPAQRALSLPPAFATTQVGHFNQATVAGTGAMASVAVRSSTDLICSLVSELPIHVYRGDGPDRVELSVPGNIEDPGGDDTGREDWVYQLLGSWLHRGNAYGFPLTDSLMRLRGLSLVNPDDVAARLDTATGVVTWSLNGRPAPDIHHMRVNPLAGVLLGFSPIEANAVTILSSIAASRFAYQWFVDGTHPQSLLVNTEAAIDADQARKVLERWRAMKSGTREPAVMGKGWELRGLDITPEQAQLMQMVGMSEAQACRIFGPAMAETLGYESGGSMTYSNVTDRRSDLLVFTLNRWIRRTERLLSLMLPRPVYARFDRDALLESTTLARYEAHSSALAGRWKTVNEVRADEDMDPVPWGDEPNSATPTAQPVGGAA